MTCETNWMQQLWFINNPLAQHISGIIMPIFRSARPYMTAYGFQPLMCWLVSWEAGKQAVCSVQRMLFRALCRAVFLNRRAAASIIPGREIFSWNLSF